jgi:hypothetical protein
VLVVDIVPDTRDASTDDIRRVLNLLEETIRLGVVFDSKAQATGAVLHRLRGMVCRGASHCVSFFWSVDERTWTLCDDGAEEQVP